MRLNDLPFWLLFLLLVLNSSIIVLLVFLLPIGEAMTLEISGHSVGQGVQNLSFAGDLINVSIMQNSSWQGWNVTLGANFT